ncbi:unnamed protein product [Phyllotreta striolata]|uniref:Syndecan n=1 Tax=Phyllotreta striolata TaxID=444603 RepID=A0A9N9XKR4_PHYSR|nr:unnamed protein product [Phyllotreta striolata]
MHFRIQSLLFWAALVGIAAAAQSNNQRSSSDFTLPDDSAIEGSGYNGEVNHDLESSGSGFGPDDEDDHEHTPMKSDITPDVITENTVPRKLPPPIEVDRNDKPPSTTTDSSVKMTDDRPFFGKPDILAAVIGGAVVGLLCAILVVMFIVYRMRKKDEGSYALGEPKQSPNSNSYSRTTTNKEFYA